MQEHTLVGLAAPAHIFLAPDVNGTGQTLCLTLDTEFDTEWCKLNVDGGDRTVTVVIAQ